MNNLQESILDAMKVFVKDSTSKLNFPLTLECEVIRCTDENKGEYEVKYLENNFLAYCQYKGFKYNPNDVVYVLIPRGDFSKTKVILGLERDELIESDLTDIEPNPAEVPSADLDTIKIGDTVYNIAGTQPTEDIVKDVKVNGSSVVDNEKVANITVPTDTVTTTQMNNAINNATRDLVSETEMNSAIGEAISDLATETYVDNAVSPKANISDVNTALSYKADKSELVGFATETYVDNAVAPKANTSDVNTALALKANTSDVTSALALKADKTELIDVEANPSDSGTADLTKLKVGNTIYDIPSGGGGTEVEANPSDPPTDDLTTIKIGDTVYDIPGGGGSGGNPGLNVIETYGSAGSKSYAIEKAGLYAIFATVTYQGSCTITLPNDAITVYSNDLTVSSRISKYLIVELQANSTVTIAMTVSQWNGCCSGVIALKNIEINQVADSISKADTTASLTLPDDDKMYLVLASCAARSFSDARDNTTGGNPKYDEKVNPSSLSKLHLSLCKGSDSPTYSMYAYDGGIASVIAYELKKDLVYVEANPEGQATEDLNTILIDDTIYKLKGSSGYGQGYTCDVLFDTPTTTSTWASPIEICTEATAKEYDMLYVVSSTYTGEPMVETVLVDAIGYSSNHEYIVTPRTSSNVDDIEGFVFLSFDSGKLKFYTGTGHSSTLVKVYGLKFESSVDIFSPQIYSEEERVVGVWTDGKPLYQKTTILTGSYTGAMNDIDAGMSNVDFDFIKFDAHGITSSGTLIHLPNVNNNATGDNGGIMFSVSNKTFTFRLGNLTYGKIIITFQYTKTTDTAGSSHWLSGGVMAVNYTEDEQIIGQWMGKTLYQKTWDFSSSPIAINGGNQWQTLSGVSTVGMSEIIKAECVDYHGTSFNLYVALDGDNYTHAVVNSQTNITMYLMRLTLSYTKTTDTAGNPMANILATQKELEEIAYHYRDHCYTTLSDYYSTEERVVGRWTDGKPLYQKTYDLGSAVTINADSWYNTDISSGDIERIIEVLNGQAQTINTWPLGSAIDSGTIRLLNERNNIITLRWFTIQYTKSTDTPGTGPTPGNLIYLPALYSEEEHEVGVWTDGKPLYQKTWDLGSNVEISNSALTQTTISASDMETIVDAFGIYSTGVTRYNFMANIGDGYIKLQTDRNNSIASVRYVTLQYTKTTDQPGSGKYLPDGQYAHHYSTSEKVVGTWIDGSTVYERTWDFGSEILIQNNSWYTTNISNTEMSKVIRVDAMNATGTYRSLEASCDTSNYVQLITTRTNTTDSVRYLTLQYTKSV